LARCRNLTPFCPPSSVWAKAHNKRSGARRIMMLTKRQLISSAAMAGSAAVLAPVRRARAALDKISVAVIPIADCAPIYLGKAKRFFAKQNLDVELSTQGGGAAIIPGVLSGQLQFDVEVLLGEEAFGLAEIDRRAVRD